MNLFGIFKGLMFLDGAVSPQLLRDHRDFASGYGNAAANARARGPLSQPPAQLSRELCLPPCCAD